MKFRSGPFASTDIHNAGSIFGIVYDQVLEFNENGNVAMHNEIKINRASFPEWRERIEQEKWSGEYSFDPDNKHVKCEMTELKTGITKIFYADFVSENMLLAEVYDNGSYQGKGQVFEKK